ncbi:MAG: 2-oxoglutarate-acceptor oxidoreductase subunit OorD [Methanoregulaceae archaeon PtaB.Bin009]|nr:MAG: 2-oxoglutarate-acceptor oxidoreductase subunit OorD [Methanoregulaceae archaeon PtaB.Bin009]OPY37996.1 MAG: 2-oxoglutarate-acceptor oxidoreductase subunit OorD [Methanoregulaceae archaeon PtaU1.Bin066]HNQ28994.1 4Fe-4S dicluster domain-containing protein [Methanolinea sp.]HNS82331.1 4Fe-4S dicluster domain-containing protein [Methanolinea sp.]
MRLVIDERRCKGCNLCTLVCPYRIFTPGTQPNARGIVVPVLDRPERCANCRLQALYGRTLCGMCQMICPDQAISWVEEKPGEARKVAIEF